MPSAINVMLKLSNYYRNLFCCFRKAAIFALNDDSVLSSFYLRFLLLTASEKICLEEIAFAQIDFVWSVGLQPSSSGTCLHY